MGVTGGPLLSRADELVRELTAEGAVALQGTFTLDREKAKHKLRQFQLADPHRWVLVLVRTAVLAGATRIDARIDADDVEIEFDGASFSREDFDGLYGSLFGGEAGRDLRARRELAVACNAALALGPRFVRLESGSVRMELRPDRDDVVEDLDPPRAGTRVHVKDRFGPGLLVELVRSLRGEIAEARLLRDACAHASVEVRLGGETISRRPALPGAAGRTAMRGEAVAGVVGFLREGGPRASVDLVVHGAWLARHELLDAPQWLRAVVEADAVRKDVSQNDVVRDEAYAQVRAFVHGAAQAAIVAATAEVMGGRDEPWLQASLSAELLRRAERIRTEIDREPATTALCSLPLWATLDRRVVDTRTVLAAERVGICAADLPPIELPGNPLVIVPTRGTERESLAAIRGERIKDLGPAVERAHARERRRQAFLGRRRAPTLGVGACVARVAFADGDVHGELALRAVGGQRSTVDLVLDGCLLAELAIELPCEGVSAVVQAPFTPDRDFSGAHRDAAMAAAAVAVGDALIAAGTQLAAALADAPVPERERERLLAVFAHALRPDVRARQLAHFGWAERPAAQRAARLAPFTGLHLRLADDPAHPFARVRLFEAMDGRSRTLVELGAAAGGGPLAWVDRDAPVVDVPDRIVLRIGPAEQAILKATLGADALIDFAAQYRRFIASARFRARPLARIVLERPVVEQLAFEGEALHGVVGLSPFTPTWTEQGPTGSEPGVDAGMLCARLLCDGRPLCARWFSLPVPGLVACVGGKLVVPNASYDDLEGDAWVELGYEIAGRAAQLMGRCAEKLARRDHDPHAMVRLALAATLRLAFASPLWTDLHLRAHARGSAEAARNFAGLQARCCRWSSASVGARVQIRVDQGGDVDLAWLDGELAGVEPSDGFEPEAHFRVAIAPWLPAIVDLPLFRIVGGGAVSLAAIASARAGGPVAWVGADVAAQVGAGATDRLLLVRDEIAAWVLPHLLGAEALEDARDWLLAEHARRRLEGRPALSLALPAGTLVKVPFEAPWRGELGIPRERPLRGAAALVRLGRRGRLVTALHLPLSVPVTAILDAEEIDLDVAGGGAPAPSAAQVERIAAICEEAIDRLMGGPFRAVAAGGLSRAWALRWLAARLAGDLAAAASRAAVQSVAGVPVFADVGGTAHDLLALQREYARAGELSFSTAGTFVRAADRLVLALEPDEVADLRILFPRLVDWAGEGARLAQLELHKGRLAPLPEVAFAQPAVSVAVERHGLRGALWLTEHTETGAHVAFGAEGRTIETRLLDPRYPCEGRVEGAAPTPAWDRVEASADQLAYLRHCARALYRSLVERGSDPAAPGESVEWILRTLEGGRATTGLLRHCVLALHAGAAQGSLAGADAKLLRRLATLPLFVLETGRAISLETALAEHPAALAHLRLWPPPSEVATARPSVEYSVRSPSPPPVPTPSPSPAPPPPTREELLLEALREELRLVRRADRSLLSDAQLERLELVPGKAIGADPEGRVGLGARHPLVQAALAAFERDPVAVSFLASVVYTALNLATEAVTDRHEAAFHHLHALHVLSGAAQGGDKG